MYFGFHGDRHPGREHEANFEFRQNKLAHMPQSTQINVI